ncbi:MAG: hypothetical protein K2Q45_05425 [Nitrosomonas sp.]|nr:hypothetical protein [Nitrosomonas sp.]
MNGFPKPFLMMIEPKLNDRDASALAQCCKAHIIICYLRAARLFQWNAKVFLGFIPPIFLYPGDQFLRMQCAKICAAAYKPFVLAEGLMYQVPQYLTFDEYRDNVFLKDVQFAPQFDHRCSFFVQAQYICLRRVEAKCFMAARLNKKSLYFDLKPLCFMLSFHENALLCVEALKSCTRFDDDVSIIVDLFKKNNKYIDQKKFIEEAVNFCLRDRMQVFYFFEHKTVGSLLCSLKCDNFSEWFYRLLRERKTPDAVIRLQHDANLSDSLCFPYVRSHVYSFLYASPEHSNIDFFSDASDEKEIRNLLSWRVTFQFTTERLNQWMNYFLSSIGNDHEKLKRLEKFLYSR